MTATLDNLHRWLERLDNAAPAGLKLNGIAFDKSYNDSFAINEKFQDNFTVFQPWGTWARKGDRSYPTPTQQAVIDVVAQSIKPGDTKCFIDIATLNPTSDFWTQDDPNNEKKSVIDTIAAAINDVSPNAEPVIRFLVGDPSKQARTAKGEGPGVFRDIFWNSEGPRIQHPKARLYVGYYDPNFHPK